LIYKSSLSEKLKMITKMYYDQYNDESFIESRPDGFQLSATPAFTYPDGIKGLARFKQKTIGFENQFNYNIFIINTFFIHIFSYFNFNLN